MKCSVALRVLSCARKKGARACSFVPVLYQMKKRIFLWLFMLWVGFGANNVLGQEPNHLHSLILASETGTLLKGTHHGLYESRDEGKTWNKRALKGEAPGTDFMTIVVDPSNPKVLFAGGHDLAVIKSEDGGMTWRRAGRGLPVMDIHALAIDPTKPQRLYTWAVGHGLYRSDDGAKTWSRIDDGPENSHVNFLTSVPIPTGMGGIFLYAGTAGGLFQSPDCF